MILQVPGDPRQAGPSQGVGRLLRQRLAEAPGGWPGLPRQFIGAAKEGQIMGAAPVGLQRNGRAFGPRSKPALRSVLLRRVTRRQPQAGCKVPTHA